MAISSDFFLLSLTERNAALEGVDALISNAKNIIMGISTADCIPVVVYDREHRAAAAIHAGWKGTVLRIVEKAIDEMARIFDTKPEQCTAAIGPGISQDSFEVGTEVLDQFCEAGFQMDAVTRWMPNSREGEQPPMKPHIDLKEVNRLQLLRKGIKEQNITVSPIDTFTDERFYSARREQKGTIKCGRNLTGFMLK